LRLFEDIRRESGLSLDRREAAAGRQACAQLVAFPAAIGGDAGDANGDGPAGDAK
jgi:hypothetical protein